MARFTIALLSQVSPFDQRSWSGITFYLNKQISKYNDVTWVSAFKMSRFHRRLIWLWNKGTNFLQKKFTAHYFLNAYLLGKTIEKEIEKKKYDFLVVGAGESELIAYLNTNIPIIYIADTTFNNMVDYYPWHSNLCKTAITQGNEVERNAIKRSAHIIYSSQWAANSAINYYGADKMKVSVIDFGANLLKIPPKEVVQNKKLSDKCRLLFLAVSWERKGGDIAYQAFLELKKMKVDCSLTIIGCNPKLDIDKDVTIIPFLDKNNEKDFDQLYAIFLETNFLIIPTRADCTPIVFSEAAAFGVPVITTITGGVTSVVQDGKNGYCLPLEADGVAYSTLIKKLWEDKEGLSNLSKSSRNEFDTRLNWDTWVTKFNAILENLQTGQPTTISN